MFTLQIWICNPFANEAIQDMQGVTEAVSKYYYSHVEIFDGLFLLLNIRIDLNGWSML